MISRKMIVFSMFGCILENAPKNINKNPLATTNQQNQHHHHHRPWQTNKIPHIQQPQNKTTIT